MKKGRSRYTTEDIIYELNYRRGYDHGFNNALQDVLHKIALRASPAEIQASLQKRCLHIKAWRAHPVQMDLISRRGIWGWRILRPNLQRLSLRKKNDESMATWPPPRKLASLNQPKTKE